MNRLNTKVGKILAFDLSDYLINKATIVMTRIENNKKQKAKIQLIKLKKETGLTEEEKLCPADSKCNHDFIKNIEILGREPFSEEERQGSIIHQKVTYIDESIKNFDIYTTLSDIPIPEGYGYYKKIKNYKSNTI